HWPGRGRDHRIRGNRHRRGDPGGKGHHSGQQAAGRGVSGPGEDGGLMPETLVLALDFLDEHPEAAVRTLEQHDTAKVAEFLQRIPETHAVLVLREALPSFVARLCRNLSPDTAARLMLELPVTRMVAILRHLDHVATDAILRECPQSRRQACNLLLRYGKDRVGAWMVPI